MKKPIGFVALVVAGLGTAAPSGAASIAKGECMKVDGRVACEWNRDSICIHGMHDGVLVAKDYYCDPAGPGCRSGGFPR